jgi:hypothetical protein
MSAKAEDGHVMEVLISSIFLGVMVFCAHEAALQNTMPQMTRQQTRMR